MEPTDYCNELTWLKNNQEPWAEVQQKWGECFIYRQNLLKKDIEVNEFLREFPIVKGNLGHLLIDLDFKKRFPEQHGKIFKNFESVFEGLLENRRKQLGPADHLILEIIRSDVNKGG